MHITVACPGGRLGALTAAHGARLVDWQARRSAGPGLLAEAARLRAIIAETRPDVVHLHCAKAGLIGRMVIRGRIPTVFSPHAWSFFAVRGPLRRGVLGWERYATRWTSAVMCVSAAERDSGAAAGIGGRMIVLPNEVSPAAADALRTRPRADVRRSLGVDVDVPLAVCAARLVRQKGQDVLVAAWDAVRAAVPAAQLVLVGDGPDHEALAAIAGDGVRFAGATDRAGSLQWMYAADVVVCPSRWEGMSLVPLEAMNLGRALVVTDVDGMAEAVPAAAARIVPPEDPAALGQVIAALLADRAALSAAGDAGRAHAVAVNSGPSSADKLVALYTELAGRVPARV